MGIIKNGIYEYSTTSKQLAEDVKFLAQSLGCTAKITFKNSPKYIYKCETKTGRIAYRIFIKCPKEIPIIHFSPKKCNQVKQQCYARKTIIDIQKTEEYGEMTCIKTSAPDELFITDNFTVTHNTRVLTERVKKLLEDGIEPQNMVIITFTRMAGEELRERLLDVPGIGDCFIGTIHAFANKIFKNSNEDYKLYNDEIETQFMTVLINLYAKYLTLDRYFLYKNLKKKVDLGLKDESELKDEFFYNESYELNVFMGEVEDDGYPENIKTLCKKHNVITFDELIRKTTEYFKEINGKVEYLFVDEFQDIGPLEKKFFIALNADNYFYVGDEKQAIYSFKGGNSTYFTNLIKNKNWRTYYLNNNYRCGSEIIDIANRVILQADDVINMSTVCMSGKKGNVLINSKYKIDDYLKEIDNYKNWFILTRTNKELVQLENKLLEFNIPYVSFRKGEMTLEEMRKCMDEDKVKLLTVHTSKGLESPNVLMWGNFPIRQKPYMRNNDELKVEYVGMTRAIDKLIVLN